MVQIRTNYFKILDYAKTLTKAKTQIHTLTHQVHRLKATAALINKRLTGLILQTAKSVLPIS